MSLTVHERYRSESLTASNLVQAVRDVNPSRGCYDLQSLWRLRNDGLNVQSYVPPGVK